MISLFELIEHWPAIYELIMHWQVWAYVCLGVLIGLTVGAIPGMTGAMGIALVLPFTFHMNIANSIALLIGIYKASMFGGAISAICFATPGTPAAVADIWDGYPLTKKGESRKAIQIALYSSTIADTLSDIVLIVVVVPLAMLALQFGSREMFALMFLVLFAIIVFGVGGTENTTIFKAFVATLFGFLLSFIGSDPISSVVRFTFGLRFLDSGIEIIPFVIGLFSISEIIFQSLKTFKKRINNIQINKKLNRIKLSGKNLSLSELISCYKEILIGWIIGTFLGILPGPGSILSSLTSYSVAKRFSKNKDNFGKGAIEGLAAAEAGNSATAGATFVPLFAFGIPGSLIAGLFIGAFMLQGITPGPAMFQEHPETIYAILIILVIANVFNLIIGKLVSPIYAIISSISPNILVPYITVLATLGVYALRNSIFDVIMLVIFGIVGYVARTYRYPLAPMLIAFIIGPELEKYLRRALLLGRGEISFLFQSKIAQIFYGALIISIVVIIFLKLCKKSGH